MAQHDSSTSSRLEHSGFFDDLDEVIETGPLSTFSSYSESNKRPLIWIESEWAHRLYFVRHLDTQAIKIGRSSRPHERLLELRKIFPGRMALIGSVSGGRYETAAHVVLDRWAIGKEWFKDSPEVNQFMRVCLKSGVVTGLSVAKTFDVT
jgi:hypothetical protein